MSYTRFKQNDGPASIYQEVKKFNTSIARTDGMVNQRAGTCMLAPADTSGVASSLVLTLFTARRRYA